MRVVRIFTRDSGDSSIEIRKVPMTGAERPMSETFGCDSIFFRETPKAARAASSWSSKLRFHGCN